MGLDNFLARFKRLINEKQRQESDYIEMETHYSTNIFDFIGILFA